MQRAARLRYQLGELARIVRGDFETERQKSRTTVEMKPMWEGVLDQICSDADKGADRFIRLNGKASLSLRMLFWDIPDKKPLPERFAGSVIAKYLETLGGPERKKVMARVEELRGTIGWRNFFEWPFS